MSIGPRLRNNSDLRHAFCMMNDRSMKVTFAYSRHTVTSPLTILLVKGSHKTRPKVNWVEMFTWQSPTAKPNGKSREFIIFLQEGSRVVYTNPNYHNRPPLEKGLGVSRM